jgi:REP element-mobilizing transposase RayT
MSTYTQIHIHTVFAVQNRDRLIDENWRERLYDYIVAIIQNRQHKVLAIGGTNDHVHILFGFRPTQSLSSLMQEVKRDSSKWINQNRLAVGRFVWQEGYGAFSHSKSQINAVAKYIKNQNKYHEKLSSMDELKEILENLEIDYDIKYIS